MHRGVPSLPQGLHVASRASIGSYLPLAARLDGDARSPPQAIPPASLTVAASVFRSDRIFISSRFRYKYSRSTIHGCCCLQFIIEFKVGLLRALFRTGAVEPVEFECGDRCEADG